MGWILNNQLGIKTVVGTFFRRVVPGEWMLFCCCCCFGGSNNSDVVLSAYMPQDLLLHTVGNSMRGNVRTRERGRMGEERGGGGRCVRGSCPERPRSRVSHCAVWFGGRMREDCGAVMDPHISRMRRTGWTPMLLMFLGIRLLSLDFLMFWINLKTARLQGCSSQMGLCQPSVVRSCWE